MTVQSAVYVEQRYPFSGAAQRAREVTAECRSWCLATSPELALRALVADASLQLWRRAVSQEQQLNHYALRACALFADAGRNRMKLESNRVVIDRGFAVLRACVMNGLG